MSTEWQNTLHSVVEVPIQVLSHMRGFVVLKDGSMKPQCKTLSLMTPKFILKQYILNKNAINFPIVKKVPTNITVSLFNWPNPTDE